MNLNKIAAALFYVYKTLGVFSAWTVVFALDTLIFRAAGVDLLWSFHVKNVTIWIVVGWGVFTWLGSIVSAALIGNPTEESKV